METVISVFVGWRGLSFDSDCFERFESVEPIHMILN